MSELVEMHSEKRRHLPQKVFVYGTLKLGFPNHRHYLSEAKYLGEGELTGIMFHLTGFPAINLGDPFSKIHGEVYLCTWEEIMEMDILEGVRTHLYNRVEVAMDKHDKVWTYVFDRDRATDQHWVIPTGFWNGTDTKKVLWNGFGKGITVNAIQTSSTNDEIAVGSTGDGLGRHGLRKNMITGKYDLYDTKSGTVMGSYTHVRDIITSSGATKPVLRLPLEKPSLIISDPSKPVPRMVQKVMSEIERQEEARTSERHLPIEVKPPERSYDEIMSEKVGIKVSQA